MLQLKSREEELKSIIRYKQNPVCKPMFYTPNVWIHIERVTWFAQYLWEKLELNISLRTKIIRTAMFHDDSEIIAWDYATPEKKSWSEKRKKEYEEECRNAIPILVKHYWDAIWKDYENILIAEESKELVTKTKEETIIHIIIEYVDKLDALMETLHELYAWNPSFLNNMNKVFSRDMTCWEYILQRVERRHVKLQELWYIKNNDTIFNISQLQNIDIQSIVQQWKNHTQDSVQQKSWIEIYDIWKQLHFDNGTSEHTAYLYTQNITY